MTKRFSDLSRYAYAHRGLWGGAIPENSIAAFKAASVAGLGCELDLRMTKDGELIVFHDATLERMCGSPERIADLAFVQLRGHRLPDASRIPTLREALEAMNGLPALIEVKIDPPNRQILPALIEHMQRQTAPATLMSFDEPVVWRLAGLLPTYAVGQLIEPLDQLDADEIAAKSARAHDAGCAYLCPHHTSLDAVVGNLPLVTWTIRTQAELKRARRGGAAPIFEGFSPDLAKPPQTPI